MLAITPLRTRRLSVQLQELSIGDIIFLCELRPDMYEAGTTALLQRVVGDDPKPRSGQVTDPRLWTVQERALAVAHYIAHTQESDPDFPVGEGRYSDYLVEGVDFAPDRIELGEVGGDEWSMVPLLGVHADTIERLVLDGRLKQARHGWWLGAMAAQLVRKGESLPDAATISEAELEEIIAGRAEVFRAFPESDFMRLLMLFIDGNERLTHIFRLDFTDDGIAFAPVKAKEAGLPPARFPFDSAISDAAKAVFGKPERAND
jgi:hypothetical protein